MNKINEDWCKQDGSFPPDNGEIIDWLTRPTIEFQFYAINQHLDFLKKSMKQEKDNLIKEASQFVNEMDVDGDEKGEIFDSILDGRYFPDDSILAINAFEQIQWRSNFLVLYSLFEYILNQICSKVENESGFNLKLTDISN